MKNEELKEWIQNNICEEFQDTRVNEIYEIIKQFNPELLDKMLNPIAYKNILTNIRWINPCLMDFNTITDNLKDLILIGGSKSFIIDDYMDWEGFTQLEIDEEYHKYKGQYIRYDDLQELYATIEQQII